MDRELLIEIGCEELPASWLPSLTRQIGEHLGTMLAELRMPAESPVETFSTPRRLTARVSRIPERQSDQEDVITGPPVAAAYGDDGAPTAAALGFARKQGVRRTRRPQRRAPPLAPHPACRDSSPPAGRTTS